MKKIIDIAWGLAAVSGLLLANQFFRSVAVAADVEKNYRIHWACTPITPYERFSCFAYRDDTGEIIATRKSVNKDADLGMPVGARP